MNQAAGDADPTLSATCLVCGNEVTCVSSASIAIAMFQHLLWVHNRLDLATDIDAVRDMYVAMRKNNEPTRKNS